MAVNINAKSLGIFIVIFLGLIFSVFTGNSIADGHLSTTYFVVGILLVIVAVTAMREFLYILMIIGYSLTGTIEILPIPFNVRQLIMILALLYYLSNAIIGSAKQNHKTSDGLDFWIWLNVAYVMTVFARNPVGFAFLEEGARVGGKPYIETLLSLIAYILLKDYKITPKLALKLPAWSVRMAVFSALAGAIGIWLPSVGNSLGKFYSSFYPNGMGIAASAEQIIALSQFGVDRLTFLAPLGGVIVLYVISAVDPTTLISPRNLRMLMAYAIGIIMILLSGFRSQLIGVIFQTTITAWLYGRFVGFIKVLSIIMVISILAILASYTSFKLPFALQRTLSFLPGNWEQSASNDAEGSSKWRFEMWKEVLSSDRYIHNKVLGDGFGYLRADYLRSLDLMMGTTTLQATDMQQEMFMINGDLHSGPVSSIRFVGYVGFAFFLPALIYLAKYAYRILQESLGTPFQFYAFFITIPVLLWPFFFVFIFGDYKSDLGGFFFTAGILKMIKNSVRDYKGKMQLAS